MLCLRCTRGIAAAAKPSLIARSIKAPIAASSRTFTSLSPLRPSIFANTSSFGARTSSITPPIAAPSITGEALDLLPKISSHPALGTTQIRCGPRDTFSPSHFVRKRRHGFLSRLRTRKGRALLKRRKGKGRSTLSH